MFVIRRVSCVLMKIFMFLSSQLVFGIIAIGDECTLDHNNLPGKCVLASNCPQVAIDFQKGITPTTCSFDRQEPIVCCATNPQNEKLSIRKSVQNCDLYSSFTSTRFARATTVDGMLADKKELSDLFSDIEEEPPLSVVGGVSTLLHEFPHMVALGWQNENNETEWNCGGSLISNNFVLTAAHCTKHRGKSPSVVRIGEKSLIGGSKDAIDFNEFGIDSIIIHPLYKFRQYYNDIALIKLNKEIIISDAIRPACLWQSDDVILPHVTVIGYGHTEYLGSSSSRLLKADLEAYNNSDCLQYYPKDDYLKDGVVSSQICAGDPSGNRDSCQGDSGGPLQTYTHMAVKIYHIIGVTSFGKACATSVPAIYTRVSSYLDWIEETVWPQITQKT